MATPPDLADFPDAGIVWKKWNAETEGELAQRERPILLFVANPDPMVFPFLRAVFQAMPKNARLRDVLHQEFPALYVEAGAIPEALSASITSPCCRPMGSIPWSYSTRCAVTPPRSLRKSSACSNACCRRGANPRRRGGMIAFFVLSALAGGRVGQPGGRYICAVTGFAGVCRISRISPWCTLAT